MAFPESFLQELAERNDIVDVVSSYVRLTKKSGSNLFGLCPFHSEKTPSFSVSPDKQIYHCFGCGKGGSVISFIMEIENLPFPDAVRLLAQRAAVEASIQEALDRLRLLDTTIERLRKDEKQMNYDVTIKTLPERQVASVRQILPCYDREGDLWHIFVRETALLHIQDGDPALCISVYHDGEYKEADVDVEIQKTVKGTYPDTEHVKFKTIPPVTVASATFQGPYRQIGEVNQAVASWVEDNGYAFDGLFFNIYHVSPHETRNPEEFVTEVCYPVRKR
mgnify:CR=1 FL=1